jgi:predicted Zn-dependent protease
MINAFTLPGGTIIVLDDLVRAASEDQLLAVLGHELGHVVHHHPMQSAYRSASVAALAGLAWGDFSGVAASVPAAMGMLRYSRALEEEADDFAVRVLADAGLGAEPLCEFFELILEMEEELAVGSLPEFLSSHPDTDERIVRLCGE